MRRILYALTLTVGLSSVISSCKKDDSDTSTPTTTTPTNAPTISGISPSNAAPGESVTITGTNLTGTTSISFNGTRATVYTISSPTTIVAQVPAGATSGNLTVATPAGTSNGVGFTVTALVDVLLVNKNWKVTAMTVSPAYVLGGVSYTDFFPLLAACHRDDYLRFETSHQFKQNEGASKCSASDPQERSGSWALNSAQTQLTTTLSGTSTVYDVLSISATGLRVRYTDNLGTSSSYTVTKVFAKM